MGEAEGAFENDVFLGSDASWEFEVVDVIESIEEADFVDSTFDKFLEGFLDEVFIVMSESEGIGTTEEHLELVVITEASIFHGMADGVEDGEWIVAAVDGYLEALATGYFSSRKACLMSGFDDFR